MADAEGVEYRQYVDEHDLPAIMKLVDEELSEPYSIFTYRYFIIQWPQLCFLAYVDENPVGVIVCKMDTNIKGIFQGYIAMLVVLKPFRGRGIATELVTRSICVIRDSGCQEVMLEAEVSNKGALALYGNLGFVRSKRLHRYYLNGVDAFRLKLRLPSPPGGDGDGDAGGAAPPPGEQQHADGGGCCAGGDHSHHAAPSSHHSHGLGDPHDHSQCGGGHGPGGGHGHGLGLAGSFGAGRRADVGPQDHQDHSSCGHGHHHHHHHHHH